jgi:hypothetical protein
MSDRPEFAWFTNKERDTVARVESNPKDFQKVKKVLEAWGWEEIEELEGIEIKRRADEKDD